MSSDNAPTMNIIIRLFGLLFKDEYSDELNILVEN